MDKMDARRAGRRTQRYLITGILTVIPIWITWWVFNFFFNQLSQLGAPWVRALARVLRPQAPAIADFILQPAFQATLAVVLTLSVLYLLGWFTTRVIGRRLLAVFDSLMSRIPLVEMIYGSTRQLLNTFQQKPEAVERVVLIPFPSSGMHAVGFVTRTFEDASSGRQLAAVYVPTTPNPTSGYMEIVPLDDLVQTDWTVDQAIAFIISAGTITPDSVNLTGLVPARQARESHPGNASR